MKMQSWLVASLLGCTVCFSGSAAARSVVVNGQRLDTAEIQYLEQLSCSRIPDGRYWLDIQTGIWGYQGGGAQGHISDNCNAPQSPSKSDCESQYRFSEDRMCYCHGIC